MSIGQANARNNDLSNGIWFLCEFAHSKIPPEDQCNMLDDDGFQIIDGIVHRIKVINSKETGCRQDRIGNCLINTHVNLVAERYKIGPVKLIGNKIYITWLGCSQKYNTVLYSHYTEEQQIQFNNLREEKKRKQRKIFYLSPSGRLKIDRNIYDAIEKEYEGKIGSFLTSEQKKNKAEREARRKATQEEIRKNFQNRSDPVPFN